MPRKCHLRSASLFIVAMSLAVNAHADFSCNVTVQAVLAYGPGQVNVLHSGRGDYTIICNLGEAYTNGYTVQPSTCAIWYVTLLRAKKNNQQVQFYFPGSGSCATLGTYSSALVPTYIGEVN